MSVAAKESAGLLMYRRRSGATEVFIAHPGGPFYARKEDGAWTIPKGEIEPGAEALATARREFREETGLEPGAELLPLGTVRLKSGKLIHAWAFAGDHAGDPEIESNTFTLEWPPRSGEMREFPEIDRARYVDVATARCLLNPAQVALVERLLEALAVAPPGGE